MRRMKPKSMLIAVVILIAFFAASTLMVGNVQSEINKKRIEVSHVD